ncbi:hypothetical protein L0F51_00330 [Afifella sp. H1R]|uniref:hypothetical protein n=1 Tax=Afifella sp. H1R TaxID=2908841 RepID=UPI001F448BCA|nr:hypothetical protein [Afifella sp. H1R]MCF1502211.1 hypothetical protein [Afifella sp. H1R]
MSTMNALLRRAIDSGAIPSGAGKQTIAIPASAWDEDKSAPPSYVPMTGDGSQKLANGSWEFSESSIQRINTPIFMPKSWDGGVIGVRSIWYSYSGASGDVLWAYTALNRVEGDSVSSGSLLSSVNADDAASTVDTAADATLRVADRVELDLGAAAEALVGMRAVWVQVERTATSGSDTLNNPVRWIGALIDYTTTAATDD